MICALTKDNHYLFVANANDIQLTFVDIQKKKSIGNIECGIVSGSPNGSQKCAGPEFK